MPKLKETSESAPVRVEPMVRPVFLVESNDSSLAKGLSGQFQCQDSFIYVLVISTKNKCKNNIQKKNLRFDR